MITPDNITAHEFIGLHTEIVESFNPITCGLDDSTISVCNPMNS